MGLYVGQCSGADPDGNRGFMTAIRIATRGSPLALWQAEHVRSLLTAAHPDLAVELVIVASAGDANRTQPLHEIGGLGLFTKEIQDAVLDGRAELAVHSLKDLPTQSHPALTLAAVPTRGTTEDALIAPRYGGFAGLPEGARLATGSLRRRAQLLRLRPDLKIVEIRGNVETRLDKLASEELDGVILAAAGLERLGLADRITERLTADAMLPAVGQGALGVECRTDDAATRALLTTVNHPPTHAAVAAERAFLAGLQGGCRLPIAALAHREGDVLYLQGNVTALDGSAQIAGDASGVDPIAVGAKLAARFRRLGARRLLPADKPKN
jgi:hydroxymethylbilane synthase